MALARGRTFDVVTQVSVGHAWLNLRDSLESAATAWYLAELADRSLEERHAAEPLYALLRRAYELLDAGMAPGRVARWYEMHLLDELGQRPEVDRCVECDRVLEAEERFRWVPPLGGVLCERCPGPPHDRAGLSLDALKLLKAYQRLDIEAIAALRLGAMVEREVEAALREFVRDALERDGSLAGLPRRGPRGPAGALMATVQLRDIVTDADREAVLGLRRAPGQGAVWIDGRRLVRDAVPNRRARVPGCGPSMTATQVSAS